jgi:hypothetical protein
MNVSDTFYNRFWAKVNKTDTCWIWTGATIKGYGMISKGFWKGGTIQTHRASWQIHFGPITKDQIVCHKCDNPSCVRPDHLFLGTHLDNMHDKIRKNRSFHPSKIITNDMISEIRNLSGKMSQKEIAKIFKIHPSNVSRIINFKARFK